MCESEYLVLSEWFNYLVSSPQLDFHVDRIIYLRTDPEVAYERIRKRNRTEENTIPFKLVKGKYLCLVLLQVPKCFVQKFIYILGQSQTFCAEDKKMICIQ